VSNWIYLTLHIRVIYPPKISGDVLYGWLSQVFQSAGVQARLGSSEQLNLPEFYDVDPGSCPLDGSVTPQLFAVIARDIGSIRISSSSSASLSALVLRRRMGTVVRPCSLA
jgi:hypothetical protein